MKTVFVEAGRRERNLRLLDPERPENYRFHVTDEFAFQSGPRRIRADVVFLANGIPVIVVETKAAIRLEGIAEAFDQIRRYQVEAPDLMAQAQLFALTHLVQFFYGATCRCRAKRCSIGGMMGATRRGATRRVAPLR